MEHGRQRRNSRRRPHSARPRDAGRTVDDPAIRHAVAVARSRSRSRRRSATGSPPPGSARSRWRSPPCSSAPAPRRRRRPRGVPLGARAALPRRRARLQIGVNYANDYSDGIRGTDDHRVGPSACRFRRGEARRRCSTVALVFFGVAAVAGLVLTMITRLWWLLAVGAVAIVAAWFYTGGKRPYGYNALGEVFVFVFFGLVATLGTTFVQVGHGQPGGLARRASASASSPAPCSSSTTSATSSRTRRSASARSPSCIGRDRRRVLYCVLLLVPFVHRRLPRAVLPDRVVRACSALLAALPACVIVLFDDGEGADPGAQAHGTRPAGVRRRARSGVLLHARQRSLRLRRDVAVAVLAARCRVERRVFGVLVVVRRRLVAVPRA